MKKFGSIALGIILIGVVYYFTSGSSQLSAEIKAQVNAELASLQTEGFSVEKSEPDAQKEHIVIGINEPSKVAAYLTNQGIQITPNDIASLEGFKLGVDIAYLADTYSAASFALYPVALPQSLTSASLDEKDQKVLEQIKKMIDKKTFLVHIDVNKLGNGFKGYMKDINEVIEGEIKMTLTLTELLFNGDLKNNKLANIKQTLKKMTLSGESDTIDMQIHNLNSSYNITGTTRYDYNTDYSIEKILLSSAQDTLINIDNVQMSSSSYVKDNLASMDAHTKVANIDFIEGQKKSSLDSVSFKINASNFDMNTLEKLEHMDPNNEKELRAIVQQLISNGIHFEIPDLSVKNVEFENQKLDGFRLASTIDVDKSLDIASLENNPMAAMNAITANLDLKLSNKIFEMIAKQPQAMMAIMLFQPKEINGQKVYTVELKEGKVSVNGTPMM